MVELKEKLNQFIQDTCKLKNYEETLIDTFDVIEAKPGSVIISYQVKRNACNYRHLLHGAASASFTDLAFCITWGSTVKIDQEILNLPATININLNYLSSAKLGETILIHSKIERKTNSLVFLKLKMVNKSDGRLLNTATGIFKTLPSSKL